MIRKTLTGLFTAATLSAVVVAATPAMAFAGPPAGSLCAETTGAKVCFEKLGDVFWVKDTVEDGHHADAAWTLESDWGDLTICHDYQGVAGGWTYCEWADEIPEHTYVLFAARRAEGDRVLNASSYKRSATT